METENLPLFCKVLYCFMSTCVYLIGTNRKKCMIHDKTKSEEKNVGSKT